MIVIMSSDGKVPVNRGSAETRKEFGEKLEASLSSRNVAYNEPQKSDNL